MINYFDWQKRKIAVTSLRLDSQNPRLTNYGKKPTQPEIIDYLIEHEKVIDLAKSIISQGYFLNEQPIVNKENDRYVVLEGNRRVAACKILINPDLIKNVTKSSNIKKLVANFDLDIISKLEVIIAPSREAADIMIVNRHTEGSVVEKWDKTKQDRFFHNRYVAGESIDMMAYKFSIAKSDLRKALQRYSVFNEINKIQFEKDLQDVLQNEVKFSMTNVERVYESKYGRDFLGIDFDNNGEIIRRLPIEEFTKRLKKIVEEVYNGNINSRTLNKEDEDKKPYFEGLLKSGKFDTSIELDKKYNVDNNTISEAKSEESDKDDENPIRRPRLASSAKLFAKNLYLETGVKRIDNIFYELKVLNLKSHSNAIAMLIRSYIDMVTYQFLKKNGGIDDINKKEGILLNSEKNKVYETLKKHLIANNFNEELIDEATIVKILKLKGSVKKDYVPSLRHMLEYLTKTDLISDPKLKVILQSYINKDSKLDKIIGHNEFNLLVHNEYYTNDPEELKRAWEKLEPILEHMITQLKISK